jgi:hypothetical protein
MSITTARTLDLRDQASSAQKNTCPTVGSEKRGWNVAAHALVLNEY